MKKLIKRVNLRFFQDDANGEFGLTHSDTIGDDSSFNAFWDGQGLFHDVWEHAHEHTDPHFRGEYAMNVGGEMAAMGALWYYYDELGVNIRLSSTGYYTPGQNMRVSTESMVQEAISHGYASYGNELLSNVPAQTETDNSELECQIETFIHNVAGFEVKATDANERKYCEEYKASATGEKISNLHRYGYRMAEKLVPRNYVNANTLSDFLTFWNTFTKAHKAEDLANYLRGVEFSIYREGEEIFWKAKFIPSDGVPREELAFVEHPMTVKSWEIAA